MVGVIGVGVELVSSSFMRANLKVLTLGLLMKSEGQGLTFRLNATLIAL